MRLAAPLLTCAALVVLAPVASAADKTAPPGNSGISQYLQVVPSASGPKTPGPKKGSSPLTKRQRSRLARSGADGRALAGIVASTSPASATTGKTAGAGKTGKAAQKRESSQPESASSSLVRGVTGSGGAGLGVALPLVLVAIALGAVAITALRLRRRSA